MQILGRAYDMSILEVINHFPLDYACRLMVTDTEVPLLDIIKQSGLSSTSTFFRNLTLLKE